MQITTITQSAGQAHTGQRPRAALPPQRGWTWSPRTWKWQSWSGANKSSQNSAADGRKPKRRATTLSVNEHELTEWRTSPSTIRVNSEATGPAASKSESPPPMSASLKDQENLELRRQVSIQLKRGEVQERLDREYSETCECRARVLIL